MTACTFSPMTNNKQGRFKEVSGKVDTRWKTSPRTPSLGHAPSSHRIAPTGLADAGTAKNQASSAPQIPSSSEQGWTTVATTVATGHRP